MGFHLLFERSYEFGLEKGFGFIKGRIVKFKLPKAYKIPHMGWNQILKLDKNIKAQPFGIYKNIYSGEYVYVVHSYYPKN
ncbi:MAG TPA: imidazole glycerol phosphate synthase subunit HisH, partial [Desulfobacterales bacterium]|nr:imidazole glycerol phosphate synthase subunit HisH [Desulfobacterales bacterium]